MADRTGSASGVGEPVEARGTDAASHGGLRLAVDATASEPPFEQVRRQIIEAVQQGILVAGFKLPTVRALADELRVAPNTIARSYRELERDEVIETRGRNGSFVAANGDGPHRQGQLAALAYVSRARQLRLSDDEALELVRSALRT